MSQICMTNPERVEALQSLGYTARGAAFLVLAALHGGYFLRRQAVQYTAKTEGQSASSMLDRLLAGGHAQVSVYAHNVHVYHLCSRPFYAAMGQSDNRNRRERQPLTIKSKLMALDFVLAHPDYHYLATEAEKFDYFTNTFSVQPSAMPTKLYRANCRSGGDVTARYFVDKYPIFAAELESASPVVSFCFVNEGQTTLSHFETFLSQYSDLLAALPRASVVYIAATRAPFQRAEQAFNRGLVKRFGTTSLVPNLDRIIDYFEARKRYESNDFGAFDRGRLIQLRDDRAAMSGQRYESLFRLWTAGGVKAVAAAMSVPTPAAARAMPTFSTFALEYTYDFFGNLTAY